MVSATDISDYKVCNTTYYRMCISKVFSTLRGNTEEDKVSRFAYTIRRNTENKELCDKSYAEKIAASK